MIIRRTNIIGNTRARGSYSRKNVLKVYYKRKWDPANQNDEILLYWRSKVVEFCSLWQSDLYAILSVSTNRMFIKSFFGLFLLLIAPGVFCDNYFKLNTTILKNDLNDSSENIQPRVWSEVFENWIVSQNNRETKVLQYDNKIVNVLQQGQGTMQNKREVSETDLYLLGIKLS